MPAPISVIYAPAVVLRDNRYQILRLIYMPRNILASKRIGTTFNPTHIFILYKIFPDIEIKGYQQEHTANSYYKNFITRAYTRRICFSGLFKEKRFGAHTECLHKQGDQNGQLIAGTINLLQMWRRRLSEVTSVEASHGQMFHWSCPQNRRWSTEGQQPRLLSKASY